VRYRPPEAESDEASDRVSHAVHEIRKLWKEERGDILAFFPGEREIFEAARALKDRSLNGAEVLTLYARLPLGRQRRAIEAADARRIVLATNVAETSLTVPNVRCVVDTGVARVSRYNRHAGVQRLPIEPVSRASAAQRKGRCGRVGPGICVRLYSEADYDDRPEYTEPEILRTNLASVLLRMRALGIRELESFPFVESPARRHVNDGLRLLRELGALDSQEELTETGRRLARLPLDPRLGRMLLAAEQYDCVAEILVIASALSVADPRDRPPGRETAAHAAHRRYADERSDFLTLLNLWTLYQSKTRGLSEKALRAFCRKRFLSLNRMREWRDVHDQLRALTAELGIHRRRLGAGYARIHKALLAGLLRNVGFMSAEREYTGVRGADFRVAPGSAQHAAKAKWIMASELVETSRLFAFTAARVRPEWIEEAAGDLVRKSYFEAHWDEKRGEAMVYEQVALYGLTIIPKRRRRYAPISPKEARRIFIRSALIEGRMNRNPPFLERNRAIMARLRAFDDRLRQPDVLFSERALYDFYDHRVPSQVFDLGSFDGWVKQLDEGDIDDLTLDEEAIVSEKLSDEIGEKFPDELEAGSHRFPLRYRFAPGEPDDGITAQIPSGLLRELEERSFDRLVPGYLEEKIQMLLRALAKSLRRELVPLNEFCAEFMSDSGATGDTLTEALAAHARRVRGVEIPSDAWREQRLPDHLRMRFAILDSDGREIAAGRELADLQRRYAGGRRPSVEPLAAASNGIKDWSVGDLEDKIRARRGERQAVLYPMLEDRGDSVRLTAIESRERALELHRQGVRRLFMLNRHRDLRRLGKNLPGIERLELAYSAVAAPPPAWQRQNGRREGAEDPGPALSDQILEAAVTAALGDSGLDVRKEAAFRAASEVAFSRLPETAAGLCALCEQILERHRSIRGDLEENPPPARQESIDDIRMHLDTLVYRGFVRWTPIEHLQSYPRYLDALERRIAKLRLGGSKDSDKVLTLAPLWQRFVARSLDHLSRGRSDPERDRYRWMVEEYRVSLFAQELGTAYPVSHKRLDTQWSKVGS
ncbi:MAG: ATP-dependent RNA helicase HrpA, partial [Gammaproteobacteria bacterium]|nr:ATP-dependent RNA helicase HrpA [Gammaproteobacteria bacterium]